MAELRVLDDLDATEIDAPANFGGASILQGRQHKAGGLLRRAERSFLQLSEANDRPLHAILRLF